MELDIKEATCLKLYIVIDPSFSERVAEINTQ